MNTTPEGFRTAAYLEAKARLDARKTNRNVQCNPPNVRCGNRCIPPTWDCRLKGQGTDPHLRAVKTDPLGGLANIQRGFGRISKGIIRGNFSEVEGGKRAIVRGTVKIVPGNIQQKKELQKKLENRTRAIGIGLAVVTGGLGVHALLMKNNTFGYRDGVGKQINESVHTGVSRVLDAAPVLGAQRARTRVEAFSSVSEAVTRAARIPQAGSEGLIAGLEANSPESLRHLQNLNIGDTNRNSSSNLSSAVGAINSATKGDKSTNVYAWDQKHREVFWGAKVNAPDLDSKVQGAKARISVFARPAAEDFLVKQYNLPLENGGSNAGSTAIKAALTTKLIEEKQSHVAYAKQLGLRIAKANKEEIIHPDDLNTYILRLNQSSGITGSTQKAIKDSADTHIAQLMTGKSLSARATDIYSDTVLGFDKFYGEVAGKVKTVPGVASPSEGVARQRVAQPIPEGTQNLMASLDRVRVGDMARQLGHPRSGITGEAHAELVKSAYFANRVARSNKDNRATYFITDRLARSAASELSGRPISQTGEAFRLLQSEHGFGGASRVQSARAANAGEVSIPTSPPRPARRRLRSRAELIRTLTQGGLSAEAAGAEADRIIARRGDEDDFSPELVRTATYLAARADFKEGKRLGKPCGASHIPKAHECRKGAGGTSAQESGQEVPKTNKSKGKGVFVAAAVIGVAGFSAVASSKQARERLKNFESYVNSFVRDNTTKASQEALSRSIDVLSSKQVRQGLNMLPEPYREQANSLVGKAKKGAAVMSLEMAGYKPMKVDNENNYASFINKHGDIKSVGSVGDNLISYTFHDVRGDVTQILPPGRKAKHVVFQIDRKFDQKSEVSKEDVAGMKRMLTSMFKDSVSQSEDGTLLLNTTWDKDGKGSGRSALYRRYGFHDVKGIDKVQWAVVESGSVKQIPKERANQEFMTIMQSGRAATDRSDAISGYPRKGKPCGNSFIQKDRKCGQDAKTTTPTVNYPDSSNKKLTAKLLTAAGLATGSAVLGVLAKDVFTTGVPANKVPPKKPPEGLYDSFEPGDLIYQTNRFAGANRAHYAVYVGKVNGKHRVFDTSLTKDKIASQMRLRDIDEAQDTGTSFARAERMNKTEKPTSEQLQRVIDRLNNKNFDWNGFENNCETLARAIVNDTPVSSQVSNVSTMTRTITDHLVSVLAPKGYRKSAIKQNEVEKIVNKTLTGAARGRR